MDDHFIGWAIVLMAGSLLSSHLDVLSTLLTQESKAFVSTRANCIGIENARVHFCVCFCAAVVVAFGKVSERVSARSACARVRAKCMRSLARELQLYRREERARERAGGQAIVVYIGHCIEG